MIDGATAVGEVNWLDAASDAAAFAGLLDGELRRLAGTGSSCAALLRDAVASVLDTTGGAPAGCLGPKASVAVVRVDDDRVECASAEDISVAVVAGDGEFVALRDRPPSPRETSDIAELSRLLTAGCSYAEALARVHVGILEHRRRGRASGHAGQVTLEPGVTTSIAETTTPVRAEVLFLATDGFRRYDQLYGLSDTFSGTVADCRELGLREAAGRLRQVEHDDRGGRQFPRLSLSDDATAALLGVERTESPAPTAHR